MAYYYDTRLISARIYNESYKKCASHGISINGAANYGLGVIIKAHQRNQLPSLGLTNACLMTQDRRSETGTRATTLRIRHDYLDYMEMQGLNRNKTINQAVEYICTRINNHELSSSAISEGPQGRGIARRNVYTNSSTTGEEGQEP